MRGGYECCQDLCLMLLIDIPLLFSDHLLGKLLCLSQIAPRTLALDERLI